MKLRSVMIVSLITFTAPACVSRGTYEDEVHSGDRARAALAQSVHDKEVERARLQKEIDQLQHSLAESQEGRASMQKQLDDATVVDDRLTTELARLGHDSQSIASANDTLKAALESSRKRLEELRRAQAAAESRAALYRDLALKLHAMIDSGDLAVVIRDGRMILRMSNDVLFDSGKAELRPAGKRALAEVADALRSIPGRRLQIAGHTDNEPIKLSPFRSNWDLSTARSLEVVQFLIARGLAPQALSAAGYGEFDPIDANDTSAGRAHNRRTEITVLPNIDDFVAVPESP